MSHGGKSASFGVLLASAVLWPSAAAADVQFQSYGYVLSGDREPAVSPALDQTSDPPGDSIYVVLVERRGQIPTEWWDRLARAGARPYYFLQDNGYLVKMARERPRVSQSVRADADGGVATGSWRPRCSGEDRSLGCDHAGRGGPELAGIRVLA